MIGEFGINVTMMSDGNCTVAMLTGEQGEILTSGSAKCHPRDTYDEATGIDIAVMRALRAWADEIEKQLPVTAK